MSIEAPRARTYMPGLDIIRILAAVAVIGIHVLGSAAVAGDLGHSGAGLHMLLSTAVPVFFMMAGALNLAPGAHRRGALNFLRRRGTRIVPALLFWSVLYQVFSVQWSGAPIPDRRRIVDLLVSGQTYTHLYFLFAIAGLYLLAPILQGFLSGGSADGPSREGARAWILGIAACAWTAAVMSVPDALPGTSPLMLGTFTFALAYAGYFVIGRAAVVAPLPRWAAAAALALSLPLLAMLARLDLGKGLPFLDPRIVAALRPSYVSPLMIALSVLLFAGVVTFARAWRVGPDWERRLRTVGNATFGIFLVHFAVMIVLRDVFALTEHGWAPLLALWAATLAVSTAITLVAMRIPGLRLVF